MNGIQLTKTQNVFVGKVLFQLFFYFVFVVYILFLGHKKDLVVDNHITNFFRCSEKEKKEIITSSQCYETFTGCIYKSVNTGLNKHKCSSQIQNTHAWFSLYRKSALADEHDKIEYENTF